MPIQNTEIASILEDTGQLLGLDEASPFRIRAYKNAADTVRYLKSSLAEMVDAGEDLTQVKDIGPAIAQKIEEIVRTGRLAYMDELAKGPSAGLLALLRVPGLGPGRVRVLREKLGVSSVEALRAALDAGQVRGIAGFGDRTEQTLRDSLEKLTGDGT
ncbi:MAG: DNA polymerase (family 10) [Chlamydiales bacterium]|jgi:DNA polymerase (family 10)